jgi:hypothetical protein
VSITRLLGHDRILVPLTLRRPPGNPPHHRYCAWVPMAARSSGSANRNTQTSNASTARLNRWLFDGLVAKQQAFQR